MSRSPTKIERSTVKAAAGREVKSNSQHPLFDKPRLNSFFAGVGGFDLAFQRCGIEPSFYCENNDFCRSVLRRHWPDSADASDILKLKPEDVPKAEVWTAGFPCQDLSLARTPHGARSGLDGASSGLFFAFLKIIAIHKPTVILLENVTGLLSSHAGKDFQKVVGSLTELGYGVAWRVLNARYFGTPQSRPRIFICAWLNSPEKAAKSLFEEKSPPRLEDERKGFLEESKCPISGISVPQVSFCISATSGRHTGLDWARSYITYPDAVRRLTPTECERLQGLPDGWTLPDSDYKQPARGIEALQYRAIGNAVCVPVAEWIAKRIHTMLIAKDSTRTSKKEKDAKEKLHNISSLYLEKNIDLLEISTRGISGKWKSAGLAWNDWSTFTRISPTPVKITHSKLIDIIDRGIVGEHYFLSSNAARGIIRRVDKLGRDLFPPLDNVLRKIAEGKSMPRDSHLKSSPKRRMRQPTH
jgi:DNA (cytosine-5)-methyltransferase 1